MANFLPETPSGVINGINKVFTTAQEASLILGVFVDGPETTSYTYNASTREITLTYAPLTSIEVICGYLENGLLLTPGEVLYPREVPTGAVNGTNKVYTTLNPIKDVILFTYDGVQTTNFSFTPGTNTITLGYAPNTNLMGIIYTGYTNGVTGGVELMNNTTLNDIIQRIYTSKIQEKTTSSLYPLLTTKDMIYERETDILTVGYVDSSGYTHKAPDLKFLEERIYFSDLKHYTVLEDVSISGTSISIGDNNLKNTGYVYINGDIIKYNSNSGGLLTGLTGLNNEIKQKDIVIPIYELPSNYSKMKTVKMFTGVNEEMLMNGDDRGVIYGNNQYSVLTVYYNKKFIMFSDISSGFSNENKRVEVKYRKKIADIRNTGYSYMPEDYGMKILSNLVACDLLINTTEREKALDFERQAISAIKGMYKEFADQVLKYKSKISTPHRGFII